MKIENSSGGGWNQTLRESGGLSFWKFHTSGESHDSPWGGDQIGFTESTAEAGKSVSDYLGNGERIVYVNVLNSLSVDYDCSGKESR